jgi:GntP family gluconate:H+ symporter
VLRESQIGNYLGQSLAQFNIGIFLPFIIASALKIAQGSGTVSLITASAIVGPMLGDLGFTTPAEQALVVTAIGAGAIVMSHANDSYFWVTQQFSDLDVDVVYKSHSAGTLILGTSSMAFIFLLSLFVMS